VQQQQQQRQQQFEQEVVVEQKLQKYVIHSMMKENQRLLRNFLSEHLRRRGHDRTTMLSTTTTTTTATTAAAVAAPVHLSTEDTPATSTATTVAAATCRTSTSTSTGTKTMEQHILPEPILKEFSQILYKNHILDNLSASDSSTTVATLTKDVSRRTRLCSSSDDKHDTEDTNNNDGNNNNDIEYRCDESDSNNNNDNNNDNNGMGVVVCPDKRDRGHDDNNSNNNRNFDSSDCRDDISVGETNDDVDNSDPPFDHLEEQILKNKIQNSSADADADADADDDNDADDNNDGDRTVIRERFTAGQSKNTTLIFPQPTSLATTDSIYNSCDHQSIVATIPIVANTPLLWAVKASTKQLPQYLIPSTTAAAAAAAAATINTAKVANYDYKHNIIRPTPTPGNAPGWSHNDSTTMLEYYGGSSLLMEPFVCCQGQLQEEDMMEE